MFHSIRWGLVSITLSLSKSSIHNWCSHRRHHLAVGFLMKDRKCKNLHRIDLHLRISYHLHTWYMYQYETYFKKTL